MTVLLNAYGAPLNPAPAPAPAATPAPAPAPAARAARAALPPLTATLTPTGPNPKRPGTAAYAATALYAGGPTVAAYLKAAGPRGRENLLYDLKRGYVTAA